MTILVDEAVNDDDYGDEAAVEAFLNRWKDADDNDQPSDKGTGEATKTVREDDEDDATDLDVLEDERDEDADADAEGAEDNEDDSGAAKPEASDDHVVSVTVDGETKQVPVKELKRLFGQEAALTRKSQEVSAARKAAESDAERYMLAAGKLLEKAESRFAPFAKIDWLVAQTRLSPEDFAALRAEAKDAFDDLNFLKAETDEVLSHVQQTRQAAFAEAAKESIKVLETEVPGWNREVYDKVRSFAVSNGMDAEVVNSIIDPAALKMFHMAMRLSELKEKARAKKASTPKAAPKRVVRTSNDAPRGGKMADKGAEAANRLRKTGRDEDAVAALMARWSDKE